MTALYWNAEGQIACEEHAPPRESDVWKLDRWQPMGSDTVELYTVHEGHPPECQRCAEIARGERR